MGQQLGLLNIEGKLSGLCFYVLNGKRVVRSIGTISKERYLTDANFKRVRENASELGGASKAAKALRLGLQPFTKRIGDSYISGRLSGVLRKIIGLGAGKRGQRDFSPTLHGHLLEGFELNKQCLFISVFKASNYPVTTSTDRTSMALQLPSFDARAVVQPPAGASHFKLVFAATSLCAYRYDSTAKSYLPLDSTFNCVQSHILSEAFAIDTFVQEHSLDLTLTFYNKVPEHVSIISALGIVFYQMTNGTLYELETNQAMRIISVD